LDRVQAERFIDSARRPASVRRLLKLIGWEVDPATLRDLRDIEIARFQTNGLSEADAIDALPDDDTLVEDWWRRDPQAMERARTTAPRRITEQNRMVTIDDHADLLKSHPVVALAQARLVWTGSWHSILIAALLEDNRGLDESLHKGQAGAQRPSKIRAELWDDIVTFHETRGLPLPPVTRALTGRLMLRGLIEQNRMIGSEVFLETARAASITVVLSVRAKPGYFRSELQQALAQVFTADQEGFFEPGRLGFGVPLYASDVIDAAMQIEGVAVACLNLFKRVGGNQPDNTAEGIITVDDDEFIRCMNDPRDPARGTLRITVNGGEVG
jgi:hypothetical protein